MVSSTQLTLSLPLDESTADTFFRIPLHSFTAFRMRYSSLKEISERSTTLFLGSVPEGWLKSRKSLAVLLTRDFSLRDRFNEINSRINQSGQPKQDIKQLFGPVDGSNFDTFATEGIDRSLPTTIDPNRSRSPTSIDTRQQMITNSTISQTESALSISVHEPSEEETDSNSSQSKDHTLSGSALDISKEGILSKTGPTTDDILSEVDLLYEQIYHTKRAKSRLTSEDITTNSSVTEDSFSQFSTERTTLAVPIVFKETGSDSQSSLTAHSIPPLPHTVTFSETQEVAHRRSRIKSIVPTPVSESDSQGVSPVEEKHYRMVENLKKGMLASRLRVTNELDHMDRRLKMTKFLQSKDVGQILKAEKMLVLVKKTNHVYHKSALQDNEFCDTRVFERWKEYIFVARSNSDPENPVYVQLKTKRSIHKKESFDPHSLDFKININETAIGFYSSLDKTIAVTVPGEKKGEKFYYVLKTSTQSSALEWYNFLTDLVSTASSNVFKISIPDLNLQLNVKVPWEVLEDESTHVVTLLNIKIENKGYQVETPRGLKYLLNGVDSKLAAASKFKDIDMLWNQIRNNVSLCWKLFDRLDWIPPLDRVSQARISDLNLPRVLQLRVPEAYPTTVRSKFKTILKEPTPIEGFLMRISSYSGKSSSSVLNRPVIKLEYYSTHDNFLMFSSGKDGSPPLGHSGLVGNDGVVKDVNKLRDFVAGLPSVLYNNVYQLDQNDHFSWLNLRTTYEDFQKMDSSALLELERRIFQVVRARGMVDLCDVQEVRAISSHDVPDSAKTAFHLLWNGSFSHSGNDAGESGFEILLHSGGHIKLLASSYDMRNEWISRIRSLSLYWKARKIEDKQRMLLLKNRNQEMLNIRDSETPNIASKICWQGSKALADPAIYHVSDVSLMRTILMSGELYLKPKKHSNFKKYFAILCPGSLILFDVYQRSTTGLMKSTSCFRHYLTIGVDEAYVYSGTNSSMDLLDKDPGIDHTNPTELSQPRVYADGWVSSESQKDRSFTLWFGRKRAIAGDSHERKLIRMADKKYAKKKDVALPNSSSMNPGFIKIVTRLGITGRNLIFIARSMQERDLWVSRIMNNADCLFVSSEMSLKSV